MKKLLFLLLTLTIVLCLASCDWFETNLDDDHEHTWEYVQYETGHYKQYTCGCPSPDIMGMHCDNNGDYVCDECGYLMISLDVDIEWQYGETHHWWLPTAEDGVAFGVVYGYGEHENFDADMFCDICGYHLSNIGNCDHQWDEGVEVDSGSGGYVMEYTCSLCGSKHREIITFPPENHFLRNQAGCDWLNEITAEDIVEIKMFSSGGGPLPPVNRIKVSSSTDVDVISYIFEQYYWLDTTPIDVPPVICDGGYYTVQFVLSNGTVKQFSFLIGEYFTDANGNCFEILNLPKFREGDNYTNYYTIDAIDDYGDVYAINSDGESQYIGIIPIEELQFIELCDDIELGGSEPIYYIEVRGEVINFISEDYFYFNDNREVYYQLIGKNLDELIVEDGELAQ